ncbi:MAG: XRE family transcriptional regulator, partial [Oscillospiraceae bacterium]|nr:XRE family transcriptional regulator [Oscillospiraceae bacterium]
DLYKIVKMSQIFCVSTDYLLKDEVNELPDDSSVSVSADHDIDESRFISLEDANTYMNLCERLAPFFGLGVALCIICPIPLIFLGGLSEMAKYAPYEDVMAGIGVAILLLIVAMGVGVLVVCGMQLGKWDFLEKEAITLEYGVKGIVEKKKAAFEKNFVRSIATGVVLCIVGIVPMLAAAGFNFEDYIYTLLVDLLLALVAVAVFMFVRAGLINGCYQKLLQEGEFSDSEKKAKRRLDPIATIYWCSVTAVYLYISFTSFEWHRTWIIWPVAGVLYAVVEAVAKMIMKK